VGRVKILVELRVRGVLSRVEVVMYRVGVTMKGRVVRVQILVKGIVRPVRLSMEVIVRGALGRVQRIMRRVGCGMEARMLRRLRCEQSR